MSIPFLYYLKIIFDIANIFLYNSIEVKKMISYKPLLKLLIDRNIKKQDLMKMADISSATMAKLNTNEYVSLEVIDKICAALCCQPGDILEYIPDNKKEDK